MSQADVVMLVGARLNWLLSRGHGKWNPDGRFIQLDIEPEEIDCNRPIAAPVIGDIVILPRGQQIPATEYALVPDQQA